VVLHRVLLFLGPLSFIVGSALFCVAVYSQLPKLDPGIDILLTVNRGVILFGCLFAPFCTSLEVERRCGRQNRIEMLS
jgi:hypothetical protein